MGIEPGVTAMQGLALKAKRSRLPHLLLILACLNVMLFLLLPRFRFDSIVIHHSASQAGNYRTIKAYQTREHHWVDAAYHLILSNGSMGVPLGHLEATVRYRFLGYSTATQNPACNLAGVHLCIVGNFDEGEVTPALRPAIAHAIRALQDKYGIAREGIKLHRDCSATACPGKYLTQDFITALLREGGDRCPPGIRRQQDRAIDRVVFSPYTLPGWAAILSLVLSGIVSALWVVFHRRRGSRETEGPVVPGVS